MKVLESRLPWMRMDTYMKQLNGFKLVSSWAVCAGERGTAPRKHVCTPQMPCLWCERGALSVVLSQKHHRGLGEVSRKASKNIWAVFFLKQQQQQQQQQQIKRRRQSFCNNSKYALSACFLQQQPTPES